MKQTLVKIVDTSMAKVITVGDYSTFVDFIGKEIPLQLLIVLINIKIFNEVENKLKDKNIN